MLGPVFVYSNLVCLLVCKDKVLEELVLELCRGDKVLPVRADLRFQAYQIKVEALAIGNALHQICEVGFGTTCEEDRESIFLFDAQLDELGLSPVSLSSSFSEGHTHDCFIPPAFPSLRLFLFQSLASCAQYARIVPPPSISEALVRLKIAKCRSGPKLWIRQRTRKHYTTPIRSRMEQSWAARLTGVVEIVDMKLFDLRNSF